MKVKFNRITKELTFLEGTTTLNSNDVLWHTLDVEMEGGALLPNEHLYVTFNKVGSQESAQGELLPRVTSYYIPQEVLSSPGTWELQILIRVYDSTANSGAGGYIQRGASDKVNFVVEEGLHFNGDDKPITNNTAGGLRTDLNEASESLDLLWASHNGLLSTTNSEIGNLKESMPYVADFNFPRLYATYEELKNNPVLNFEGRVRRPVKVGDGFGTLAMTTDDRTVWVFLTVTEVREEDGYLLKAKVDFFYDYVDGKLVNDVKILKSEMPLVVKTKAYINKPFQEIVDTFNGGIPLEWYPLMRIHEAYFNKPPKVGDTFWLIVESKDGYIFQLRASIEEVYAEGNEYYGYVRWDPHTGSILPDVALATFFVLRDPTIKNSIPLIEYEVRHTPRTYQWYLDALKGRYVIATGDLLLNRPYKTGDIFTRIVKTEDGYICLVKLEVDNNAAQAKIKDVVVLYSPEELNAIKSRLDSFSLYEIVSYLPASGDSNKLYLKPSSGQEEGNILEEWLWVNNKWEMVGTKKVEIDLTPYAKKDEVISLLQKGVANGVASLDANGKVPVEQLPDDIGGGIDEETLKDYVKFTDYATGSKAGVAKFLSTRGIAVSGEGNAYIVAASKEQITQKGTPYTPISPTVMDYAWKVSATTNAETWTDEEKAAACETIGAVAQSQPTAGIRLYGSTNTGQRTFDINQNGVVVLSSNSLTSITYATDAQANSIPRRGDGGTLAVGTPTDDAHATNRKFVADNFSAIYLHKFPFGSGHIIFYSTQKERYLEEIDMYGTPSIAPYINDNIINAIYTNGTRTRVVVNMRVEYTDLCIEYIEDGEFEVTCSTPGVTSLDDASYTVTKL